MMVHLRAVVWLAVVSGLGSGQVARGQDVIEVPFMAGEDPQTSQIPRTQPFVLGEELSWEKTITFLDGREVPHMAGRHNEAGEENFIQEAGVKQERLRIQQEENGGQTEGTGEEEIVTGRKNKGNGTGSVAKEEILIVTGSAEKAKEEGSKGGNPGQKERPPDNTEEKRKTDRNPVDESLERDKERYENTREGEGKYDDTTEEEGRYENTTETEEGYDTTTEEEEGYESTTEEEGITESSTEEEGRTDNTTEETENSTADEEEGGGRRGRRQVYLPPPVYTIPAPPPPSLGRAGSCWICEPASLATLPDPCRAVCYPGTAPAATALPFCPACLANDLDPSCRPLCARARAGLGPGPLPQSLGVISGPQGMVVGPGGIHVKPDLVQLNNRGYILKYNGRPLTPDLGIGLGNVVVVA